MSPSERTQGKERKLFITLKVSEVKLFITMKISGIYQKYCQERQNKLKRAAVKAWTR